MYWVLLLWKQLTCFLTMQVLGTVAMETIAIIGLMNVLVTVAMETIDIIVLMHVVVTVAMETIDLPYFNACT